MAALPLQNGGTPAAAAFASPSPAAAAPSTGSSRRLATFEVAQTAGQKVWWDGQRHRRLREEILTLVNSNGIAIESGYLAVPSSLNIQYIRCTIDGASVGPIPFAEVDLAIHIYVLNDDDEELEEIEPDGDDEVEAAVTAGTTTVLPHTKFDRLWEKYVHTTHNIIVRLFTFDAPRVWCLLLTICC